MLLVVVNCQPVCCLSKYSNVQCAFLKIYSRLKNVEGKLTAIAQRSGRNVNQLTVTVKENGRVQQQIKQALRTQVMQQIMTACLQADRDRNFQVGAQEVKMLEMRLSHLAGIDFHKDRFEAFLASDEGNLTLADVCKISRHLDNPDIPENERLVTYATKKLSRSAGSGGGLFGALSF